MIKFVRTTLIFTAGAIAGLLMAAFAAQTLLIEEVASAYGVDETVERLTEAAQAEGWVVAGVRKLDENVARNGGPQLRPVRLVELCEPHYAGALLQDDRGGRLSAMMPCTISVYEKSDGRAHVAAVNVALLGRLFGGATARVLSGEVAPDQARMIDAIRGASAAQGR